MTNRSFLGSFTRSQFTSFAATIVDFGLLFLLTEVFHVWYVVSVATGAAAGAVTNFLLNRYWTFLAAQGLWFDQAWKYSLVSAGSLAINTVGTWWVTERFGIHYGISVSIVSLLVGFFFNFPLQRRFVFR